MHPAVFLLIPAVFVLILHDFIFNPAKSRIMGKLSANLLKISSSISNGEFKNRVCSFALNVVY